MTTAPYNTLAHHQTDTGAAADTILALRDKIDLKPRELEPGLYLIPDESGEFTTCDMREMLTENQDRPRRHTGNLTFCDTDSFASYVAKHGLDETEITAYIASDTIKAVINAGKGAQDADTPGAPGWRDHTCTLQLKLTPDWKDWTDANGRWFHQSDFAEFVEDHLPNFTAPTGADMLDLAQSFRASKSGRFESTKRIKTGETTLEYIEEHTAKAGAKGQLTIPDTFDLAVQPYERGQMYKLVARFRYRIDGGDLLLGFKLIRVDDVHQAAFGAVVEDVQGKTGRVVWHA